MTRNINFNQRKRTFTKKVEEEVEVLIPGDHGTNGRPRIKEIPKPLPTYDQIDLQDPNDEILFQGEVAKYKACINPNFMARWIQVTEKSLRYFKGRCTAISCCNRPLMAIPVIAIDRVEKVSY